MPHKRGIETKSGPSDEVRPNKKIRVYTDQDAKLAKLYDDLSDELKNVQLEAAISLLQIYKENGTPERVLIRLIRGLCSPRKAARPGFFIALVEVFRSLAVAESNSPTLKETLLLIHKHTSPEQGASKSEKKENLLGRLAGYNALVQSHLIFHDLITEPNGDTGDDPSSSAFEIFLGSLSSISKKNPNLSEQCGKLTVDVVAQGRAMGVITQPYMEQMLETFAREQALYTPNGVALWLTLVKAFPNAKLPKNVWKANNPCASAELSRLAKSIAGEYHDLPSARNDASGTTKIVNNGVARREPHFVWQIAISYFVSIARHHQNKTALKSQSTESRDLQTFWRLAVDGSHFASESSPERKAIGFRIFLLAMEHLPDELFALTLSPNLLRCLVNQQGDAERYLHDVANHVVGQLIAHIRSPDHPSVLRDVVSALSGGGGNSSEPSQNGKAHALINKLLAVVHTTEAIARLLPDIQKRIRRVTTTGQKDNDKAPRQISVLASHLTTLFKAIQDEDSESFQPVRLEILKMLRTWAFEALVHSTLDIQESEDVRVSQPQLYRQPFQSQLWSCVRNIIERSRVEDPLSTRDTELIQAALPLDLELPSSRNRDHDKIVAAQTTLREMVQILTEHNNTTITSSQHRITGAIYIMLSISLLDVYMEGSGPIDAMSDVIDLHATYEANIDEKTEFNEITDVVLATISKTDSIFRVAAERLFSAFSAFVTVPGLEPLFGVLDSKENLAGQAELFEQRDGGEDVEDASDDEASDVGVVEQSTGEAGEGASQTSSPSENDGDSNSDGGSRGKIKKHETDDSETLMEDMSSSEGDDADEDEEEDDEANAADEALNASLGEILRARPKSTSKSNNEPKNPLSHFNQDSDSDSDSDMSDSEMENLNIDAQLSNIFRQRAAVANKYSAASTTNGQPLSRETNKSAQESAKRTMLTFKSRTLNLLNIYVSSQCSNPACVAVLVPLCQLVGSTRSSDLSRKADAALERYIKFGKKKKSGLPLELESETGWRILKDLHEEALLFRSKAHAAACSRSALFISRVLLEKARGESGNDENKNGADARRSVVQKLKVRYKETEKRKDELKSDLPQSFWDKWKVWLVSMGFK